MKTKLLDLLISSEKRKNLLILLREGPKNLADIRESLNVTSSGMIPQIRMLEQRNLISQDEKGYVLTDIGQLLSNYLYPLVKIVDIIEENEDYWNTHDFTIIPDHLLLRLYELGACKVDEVDLNTMYEPHRLFFESLSKSIWI
ncbi:MAG: transcriptional regulator, partial [ANME-2 cluster archaeon]